jgi:aspartate-semialdehyde dehydrogenase
MNTSRIKVGVLAATGTVGQRFVQGLQGHPWFELSAVAASPASVGKRYGDVCHWQLGSEMPPSVRDLVVSPCQPGLDCDLLFSALPTDQALELERAFANAGHKVFTNASALRMQADVPLLIPEVNPEHIELVRQQTSYREGGFVVANPNCSAAVVVCALAPLHTAFGVRQVVVTTLQAISGAGYPGVPSLDILDNVVPYIASEEEKMAEETRKMLGTWDGQAIIEAPIKLSAHCNRVAVRDGHLETVSVALVRSPSAKALLSAWDQWNPLPDLPTSPVRPVLYRTEPDRPQTRLDRDMGKGMTVTVGRLRECAVLDWRFVALGHNAIRGAAGGSILNAELARLKGLL